MFRSLLALTACALLVAVANAEDSPLKKAQDAFRKKDYQAAREEAEKLVKADPKNQEALAIVGMASFSLRDQSAAIDAFTAMLKLNPNLDFALDRRGDAYLKSGKFEEAVKDFDRVLELKPDFAPQHWRRGIALYYIKRYKDGAKQFETHKTANPEDVENAAWHYLCNSHVIGREKARAELIDVTKDSRVPMKEIQKLFAGKLKPDDVIKAAEEVKADTEAGKEARFYAHLYVGLWYEAEGNAAKAKEHITEAVSKYKISHYMWDVGQTHLGTFPKTPK